MKRERTITRGLAGSCLRLAGAAMLLPFVWACPSFVAPDCQPGELRVAAVFDTTVDEGTLVALETIFLCLPDTGGAIKEMAFEWVQLSPASPVAALSGANTANASFVAPLVDQDTEFVFQVNVRTLQEDQVTNTGSPADLSFEASDTVTVTVRNVDGPGQPAPQIVTAPDQFINEGQIIQLDPASLFDLSSFANQVLGFTWEQILPTEPLLELSDPNAAMPTVTVLFPDPVLGSQIELMYQLTVDLAEENAAAIPSGQVVPSAFPAVGTLTLFVNQFPEADAGDGGVALQGSPATLDGSGSFDPEDPDNPAALTYFWELIDFIAPVGTPSGPEDVVLDDPTSPTPHFIAPAVTQQGAILVFQLTVSDGQLSSTDTTEVFVRRGVPEGGSTLPPDPCDGVVCPEGQVCDPATGTCVNPCDDVVCPEGLVCDPQTGNCVDPCDQIECPAHSTCIDGECVCDEGFVLNVLTGQCEIDLCADVVCPPNSHCSGQGFCDCDPGYQFNFNGDCVPIDPCANVECGPNEICVDEGGTPVCICDQNAAFECEEINGGIFDFETCECILPE